MENFLLDQCCHSLLRVTSEASKNATSGKLVLGFGLLSPFHEVLGAEIRVHSNSARVESCYSEWW